MPAIVTREPEQLSLFDLFESNAQDAEPVRVQNVILPLPAASKPIVTVEAKPQKNTTVKKPSTKEHIAAIMSEPECKAFSSMLEAAVKDKDFQSLLDTLNVKAFNINKEELIWDGVQRNRLYAAWNAIRKDCLSFTPRCWDIRDNAMTFIGKETRNVDPPYSRGYDIEINFAYLSRETAELLVVPVTTKMLVMENDYYNNNKTGIVNGISVGKPFLPAKFIRNLSFIQPEGALHQIILQKRPWIKDWLVANPSFSLKRYLAAPWLETLSKAGFSSVADQFLNTAKYIDDKAIDNFNRLCGPGTKPKDIFKCSKTVYTVLKNEKDLQVWDTIRRLDKKDQITGDSILLVYQMGLQPKELDTLNSILGKRHGDKPVFTVASLVNYLNRLDMYEAISTREALPLLNDYLHMCGDLHMPPRIDGDSLKREHDIAARLCREQRDRIAEEKMRARKEQEQREIEEGNSKLSRAEYHENIYFVRPITDYDDLLDEAIQQDNCVASYAGRIASGQSRIFTMRETAHPEKSLVTIELSPDCKTIRQKFLAHNQVIRNKAMSDFIERWHRQLNAA